MKIGIMSRNDHISTVVISMVAQDQDHSFLIMMSMVMIMMSMVMITMSMVMFMMSMVIIMISMVMIMMSMEIIMSMVRFCSFRSNDV